MVKNTNFKERQLIIYKNMIGKIKKIRNHEAFIWFHAGDTAALTNLDDCIPIINDYCIEELLKK